MYNKWQTLSIPVWEQFGKCSWSPGSVLSKCLIFCKKAKPSLSDMSHSFDRKLLTNTHKLTLTFLQEFSQTFSLMICEFFAWYFRHISKNNWYYSFGLSSLMYFFYLYVPISCYLLNWYFPLFFTKITFSIQLELPVSIHTARKMKFPIKDFFSKCDQIRNFGFGYIYWRKPNGKLQFLCSDTVWRTLLKSFLYNGLVSRIHI